MFRRSRDRAVANFIKGWLFGKPDRLLDLESSSRSGDFGNRFDAGFENVQIDKIRGSVDRSDDFDNDFNPRRSGLKQRWVKVYSARINDVELPPVELIKLCDSYFVVDGHHRVSVARAMGGKYIDAHVTVWNSAMGNVNIKSRN